MDDFTSPEDEHKAIELIEGGSEIAGAVTGAAIGLLAVNRNRIVRRFQEAKRAPPGGVA